jgi:hypothetical protein
MEALQASALPLGHATAVMGKIYQSKELFSIFFICYPHFSEFFEDLYVETLTCPPFL